MFLHSHQKKDMQMGFSIEKHNKLGLELADLHERMLEIMIEIYEQYPKDSEACMRANRAAGVIMELRFELDACVTQEHGKTKDVDPFKIYFSRTRQKKTDTSQPMLPSPEYRQ
jgi:hypothetical protein